MSGANGTRSSTARAAGEARPGAGARAEPGAEHDIAGAVWTLVRTDFRVRYHGTWMGFLWALLKPLATLAVLLTVFGFVFASTPDYVLHVVLGVFLYEYFQEATKTGLISLHQKGYLLTRSRFPRWILVVASTANPLVTLAVSSFGLIAYLALAGRPPGLVAAGLYLLYLAHFVAIVVGFSLAASVLFVRYRDLNQVWEVISQAGFFVAPVIYPIGAIPERYHLLLYLWPPTPVMQFSRAALSGGPTPTAKAHLLLTALAAATLAIGIAVYRRLAPRAAEYL
jgi:lipopolysaccharide transport system permease protein